MLHQERTSLTTIPSDEELCDAVLKEFGLRRNYGAALEEVCGLIDLNLLLLVTTQNTSGKCCYLVRD